jgi:outer membrane lipoprotein-sorting protein
MKKFLTIFTLSVLAINSLKGQQDPEAEPFLQKLATQFSKDECYEIEMEYTRLDQARDQVVEGEGTIQMKGDMYKIYMDEFIIYFDGEKQYSQNIDNEEVYVSIPDPDNRELLYTAPINILRSYKQDFKYQFMGIRNFMGKDRYEVQLYPKEPGGPYALLRLFMDTGTRDLVAMQLRHKEGLLYTMMITDIQKGLDLTDDDFRFDPSEYPDTDIIEIVE